MRIAYILLVHTNPVQVRRLVNRLNYADIWIHIDGKSPVAGFLDVQKPNKVYLVEPRIAVQWASYTIVQAMLNSMKAVIASGNPYDYITFLSGQDYPIQPSLFFHNYLHTEQGYEFIGNRPLEESRENITRVRSYFFNDLPLPLKQVSERLVNMLLGERVFPFPFIIRKGPQWMTLTLKATRYILEFVTDNPQFVHYFKYVHAPDEFFFQTILYNSSFRAKMKNQIFHYIDWSEKKSSPKNLTVGDREALFDSPLFFARKFDSRLDPSILNVLDEQIEERMAAYSLLSEKAGIS